MQQINAGDVIDQFLGAMAAEGIICNDSIIADGRIHKFKADGDRGSRKRGWYLLHMDGKPSGAFGHYSLLGGQHGIKWTCENAVKFTPEERRAFREQAERKRLQREQEQREEYAEAAARARLIWDQAVPTEDHPYLERKGVNSHGLRIGKWEIIDHETGEVQTVSTSALLVPFMGPGRRMRGLQAIFPNSKNILRRDKDTLKGCEKMGSYYPIGRPQEVFYQGEMRKVFMVGEGYATVATCVEAIGHMGLVAFDAGNLIHVARRLRKEFPDAVIVFLADNDLWSLGNPGLTAATDGAKEVGGLVMVPPFTVDMGTPENKGPSDFNDWAALDGHQAIIDLFTATVFPAAEVPAEPPPEPPQKPERPTVDEIDLGVPRNPYFRILGYDHEKFYVFSTEKRQICVYTRGDFSESGLIELAPLQWWEMTYPSKAGMDKKAAFNAIARTAHERGIYDMGRLRGRGAWIDRGRLVFHHGRYLSVDGEAVGISDMDSSYTYELAASLPDPADDMLSDEDGQRLIEIAQMFRWTKPASAALLAGWVALAPLSGALRWRPHVWLSGGSGSGKTTALNSFVHLLLNGLDIYAQGNSTEAGIRQTLGVDCIPVLIDEGEQNDERERNRMQGIISMIRQASTESQARTLKGTASGEAMQFHIRSMFCLASIQVGIKQQADIERISVLSLRSKREDSDPAHGWEVLSAKLKELEDDDMLPARLFRRSLAQWPVIRESIRLFSTAAARRFGTQRDGDQYGTLLAGAWSLTNRRVPTVEEAAEWIERYDWSEHMENHDSDESQRAMAALMETHLRVSGGITISVFEALCAIYGKHVSGAESLGRAEADALLARHGMRLKEDHLLLSNNTQEIARLMSDTPFGADLRGVLLRYPGAHRYKGPVKFNGVSARCIALPVYQLVHGGDDSSPF